MYCPTGIFTLLYAPNDNQLLAPHNVAVQQKHIHHVNVRDAAEHRIAKHYPLYLIVS
jgi:hypothetical protein